MNDFRYDVRDRHAASLPFLGDAIAVVIDYNVELSANLKFNEDAAANEEMLIEPASGLSGQGSAKQQHTSGGHPVACLPRDVRDRHVPYHRRDPIYDSL